jgi:hypothetical protein
MKMPIVSDGKNVDRDSTSCNMGSASFASANFRSMIETREVRFKQEGKTALILNLISHTETTLVLGGYMAELGISVV